MSIVLAAALAASTASLPSCSWDRPGVDPFMGNVVAAVDRYADIPAASRAALKARMAGRQYDDIATITRDGIAGQQRYSQLRDMHFGNGRVCRLVTRDRWSPSMQERGLVYCEAGHCIIVPTVCRNVSRVTRLPQAQAAQMDDTTAASRPFPSPPVEQSELLFDAPSAGLAPSLADSLRDPAQMLALLGDAASSDGADLGLDSIGPLGGGNGSGWIGPLVAGSVAERSSSSRSSGSGGGSSGGAGAPPASVTPLAMPIPEPSTWALLLGGLALLGAVSRRRTLPGGRPG